MTEKPERFYFMDNMRSHVAFWVVVLHAAFCYMEYGPDWYPVRDPQRSVVFTLLILLVEPTLMTTMFFLAAFFSPPSLASRGTGSFLKSKVRRIGIPWVLGVLVVVPATDYLIVLARPNPPGFVEFYTGEFWQHYHHGPYWFLGVVMVFFVMFALACRVMPWLLQRSGRAWVPAGWMIFLFWAAMTLGVFAIWQVWGSRGMFHIFGNVIAVMPQRIHVYVSYFILGVVAWRNRWFTAAGYDPRPWPWLMILGISMPLYAGVLGLAADERSVEMLVRVLHLDGGASTLQAVAKMKPVLKLLDAAVFNAISLSGLLGLGALFKRCFNSSGPVQRSLAANTLGIYFIHAAVLYPVAYLFVGITLPLALKYTVVALLSFFLSWTVSALILRKTPLLREIF